ncbi:MAG: endo-1,4-beta-xylanase [Defluviitaleaceae bacterium]|nr:endo-1,4-beta-xylanase [Defluviitaleaceae bacterium]
MKRYAVTFLLTLSMTIGMFSGVFAAEAAPFSETGIIWSLAEDEHIQGLPDEATGAILSGTPFLTNSGSPTFTIVPNPTAGNSILIESRNNQWDGLDVLVAPMGMIPGGTYAIRASGRLLTAPTGGFGTAARSIQFSRPETGWGAFGSFPNVPTGQLAWSISLNLTHELMLEFFTDAQPGIRIRSGGTAAVQQTIPFIIDNIEVERVTVGDGEIIIPGFQLDRPSLHDAFSDRFLFGNIWSTQARMNQFNTPQGFPHHFNAATAENAHKVDAVLGAGVNAWNFNWGTADSIVNWAESNDIAMIGHTLVWHSQSRPWLAAVGGQPVTRQQAVYNMERFIRTVAGRYAGRIYSWDVLNEVISSSVGTFSGNWRNHLRNPAASDTRWYAAFANGADISAGERGCDFIYYAFKFARRYDPFAILYYNDYNEEQPGKREAIFHMIQEINTRWAHDFENNHEAVPAGQLYTGRPLIEGMGMQSHYHIRGWTTNFDNVLAALRRYIELGIRVSITELDITVWGSGTSGELPAGQLQSLLAEQAQRYAQLFEWYLEYADYIGRVSIWGKADNHSWRATGHPLLFNANLHTKPAFYAILDVLENTEHQPNISVPVVTNDVMFSDGVIRTGTTISTINLEPFAAQFTATQNNFAPILWSIDGNLPPGLRLIPTTGAVIGTPTAPGEFNFTVYAENASGIGSQTFAISVSADSPEIEGDAFRLWLRGGNFRQLSVYPIHGTTWASSDNSIASVSANGLVTAYARGTVTITATNPFGSDTATITITNCGPSCRCRNTGVCLCLDGISLIATLCYIG